MLPIRMRVIDHHNMKRSSICESVLLFVQRTALTDAFLMFELTIILVLVIALSFSAAAATDPGASTFQISDRVLTVSQTPTFSNLPFAGRFAGNQPANTQGSITDGPVRASDVWWWKVRFDSGTEGWAADRQIRKMNGQLAGPISSDSIRTVRPPISAPFVRLTPASGSTVRTSRITVQGKVTNDIYAPYLVSFSINGTRITLDRNGNFSYPLNLRSGRNTFTLQASTPNPRQQITRISAYLDGSVVYGSDATRSAALRTFQGGRLKTSAGDLPPLNTDGLPNANDAHLVPDAELFLAGDVRANENVELSAIHTLFVREHNLIATALAAPCHNNDEQIYQTTRRIVAAELQAITYNEFLPALLGPNALRPYSGYKPDVNPGIATEFSTAAFRIGHTLINDDVEFLDNDANPIRDELELDETFFNPNPLKETGPAPLLKYLATDNAQEVDTQLVPGLRNFLFGPPGAGGFDLASLNIQRGRDHGLSDYNSTRAAYGLPPVTTFAQITSNPDLQARLATLYGDVNQIDLWVGGLSEDHVAGSSMGPTFQKIITDQFERIRDGDRNWYTRNFYGSQLQAIAHTRLSDVLRRNTTINKIQDNVFYFDESMLPGLQVQAGYLPPALINSAARFTSASLDGTGNNLTHPVWGTAGFDLMRFAPAAYADSIASPAGAARPSARLISNTVCDAPEGIHNARNLSDWIYGWGQFVDHDLDLTQSADTAFDIPVPPGDTYFDPDNTGTASIYFSRSIYDAATGVATPNIQMQTYVINYQPLHY
jgi:heme peroxidase/glucodextranase-like protein